MLFRKWFSRKKKIIGRVVYDLYAHEVGEISDIRGDKENEFYDILSRFTKLKLSFPADQFFIDETGGAYLLPIWSFHVRVSNRKLLNLRNSYLETNILADAIEPEIYSRQLVSMLEESIPYGEDLTQNLPKFEELLLRLKKGRTKIIKETSELMTRRLLESGSEKAKFSSPALTKKQYSLKIIDLRQKYKENSELHRFVSKMYADAKASLYFLEELTKRVRARVPQGMEELTYRADVLQYKGNEMILILDSLEEKAS
jgi:hypothetical protein